MLGDIGGLFDALIGIAKVLLSIYTLIVGSEINAYILGAIFKIECQDNKQQKDYDLKDKIKAIKNREPFKVPLFPCLRKRTSREKIAKGM